MPQISTASPIDNQQTPNAFRMQDHYGDGDLSLQKPDQPKWERHRNLEDEVDSHSITRDSEEGDIALETRNLEDDESMYGNGSRHFSANLSNFRPSGEMDDMTIRSPTKSHAESVVQYSHDIGEAVLRPSMESDTDFAAGRSSSKDSNEYAEGGYSLFRGTRTSEDSTPEEEGLETQLGNPMDYVQEGAEPPNRKSAVSSELERPEKIIQTVEAPTPTIAMPSSPQKPDMAQEVSGNAEGVSEYSHQQLTSQPTHKVDETPEEDEWQEMPAYAPFDIYDDDGKLIAREAVEESGQVAEYANLGGAAKGYTRVQVDDDAQSATSMDEDTAYLFKNKPAVDDETEEELRDPLAQMKATKTILTDSQRIAYVGVVRLAVADMVKDVEKLERTRGSKKEIDLALDAMRLWGQKMMVRLYSHMELDSAEQMMIEQLAEHGLVPADLTPTLMQNARVKNPIMIDETTANIDETEAEAKNQTDNKAEARSSTQEHIVEDSLAPPPYDEIESADMPRVRTPSQLPKTDKLDIDIRWTVLCDLFLILISDSIYDARSRALLERVGHFLSVEWLDICRFEKRVTDALEMQEAAQKEDWDEEAHMENRKKRARRKKLMLMGLATVGGGLVIGLSAGLLAPVIGAGLAAGFTTIGVSGTGTFLAGAGGAAVIGTGAAGIGGSIGGRAANRRMGAVKTYEYRPLHNNKRVNLIVTVAGWMNGKVDDVRLPYSTVDPIMGDVYSILWEPEMLRSMGDTINILATEALTQGLQQILGSTILISLMAALQLPVVLTKLAYLIDNPWSVSQTRADMAGLILADSLIDRNLGARPITLVGFSLGSRLIFSALRELASRGAVGLVQNVYLFGSPVVVKKDEFLRARTVVSGRFVNGYATNDWILGYLFRATSGGVMRVAGLGKVDIPGIENFDVTEFVPGHMAYRKAMPRVLREVGWAIESDEFSEIEDPDPDNHEKRQRELINEIEEARRELQQKPNKKLFGLFRTSKKAAKKKEWEMYEHKDDPDEGGSAQNGSVLFDIEAIRREAVELAVQGIEIKELKSTLPPMKLNPSASGTSDTSRGASSKDPSTTSNGGTYDGASSSSFLYDAPISTKPASKPATPPPPETNHPSSPPEEITLTFGSPIRKRVPLPPPTTFPDRTRNTSPFLSDPHEELQYQKSTSFDLPHDSHRYHAALSADFGPPKRSPSSPPVLRGGGALSGKRLGAAWGQDDDDDGGDLGGGFGGRGATMGFGGAAGRNGGNVWAREEDEDEFGREREMEMTFE